MSILDHLSAMAAGTDPESTIYMARNVYDQLLQHIEKGVMTDYIHGRKLVPSDHVPAGTAFTMSPQAGGSQRVDRLIGTQDLIGCHEDPEPPWTQHWWHDWYTPTPTTYYAINIHDEPPAPTRSLPVKILSVLGYLVLGGVPCTTKRLP